MSIDHLSLTILLLTNLLLRVGHHTHCCWVVTIRRWATGLVARICRRRHLVVTGWVLLVCLVK